MLNPQNKNWQRQPLPVDPSMQRPLIQRVPAQSDPRQTDAALSDLVNRMGSNPRPSASSNPKDIMQQVLAALNSPYGPRQSSAPKMYKPEDLASAMAFAQGGGRPLGQPAPQIPRSQNIFDVIRNRGR